MSERRKNPLLLVLDGSFVLGAACTIVFYVLMLSPGMKDSWLRHYTTEHYVEYVVVALSFWGIVDIVRKLVGFPREAMAVRQPWFADVVGRQPVSTATQLQAELREQPTWLRNSRIGRRFDRALQHLIDTGSAADFRDYLRTLAEGDADRTHANYTLVRFVIRITPVLGFLGTVVHFGTALNGVSFDKMTDHLGVIVSEMGQAFNTTTSALASAMVMMFAQFVCEWIEQGIVRAADKTVERQLLNRFEVKDANLTPFLAAVKSANDEALGLVAGNLGQQVAVWEKTLERVFHKFDQRQVQETTAWAEALDSLHARHESYDAVREERLRQLLEMVDERQEALYRHLEKSIEKVAALRDGVETLTGTLDRIARGEGKLAELQAGLVENLQAIRSTQQLDEAVHGLTAAIHLLTARHHTVDGAKRAA